jgi:hypothetical protein
MTELSLTEIFELDSKRKSKGAWVYDGQDIRCGDEIFASTSCNYCGGNQSDYAFMAAAPDMIFHLKRLQAEIERKDEALRSCKAAVKNILETAGQGYAAKNLDAFYALAADIEQALNPNSGE